MNQNFNYIDSLLKFKRQDTEVVNIGMVTLGGLNPIRLQSMTDTDTKDTEATVNQIIRILDAGADFVRVTVQGIREAENLKNIRAELDRRGYPNPLVADVHFNPATAEIAIKYVRKVRINPGNFYDKRAVFEKVNYSDDEYRKRLITTIKDSLPIVKIFRFGTRIQRSDLFARIFIKTSNNDNRFLPPNVIDRSVRTPFIFKRIGLRNQWGFYRSVIFSPLKYID